MTEIADKAPTAGTLIADLLVQEGQITPEQLAYATRVQAKLTGQRPLVTVLQELGLVDQQQVRQTLQARRLDIRLGDLLYELGVLKESDLKAALALHRNQPDQRFGQVLVDNAFLGEETLLEIIAVQLGLPYLRNDRLLYDEQLVKRLRPATLRKLRCVPVRDDGGGLLLVFEDPLAAPPHAELQALVRGSFTLALARRQAVEDALGSMDAQGPERPRINESLVVRKVDALIQTALDDGVSDIHIEPLKDRLRVRMRQDGVLIPREDLPLDMARPLTSRIKIMAGADIAERRRHQDGRILYEKDANKVDLRVSFYATVFGEKVALRLLNNRSRLLDVSEVGMQPRTLQRFKDDVLDVPSGVTLVTGPTGSGKTTTLYGAINYLNNPNTSIITAEDPVEYVIEGINQCSINAKIGITYEETLRHIVRQDPDVIVIGEIRDKFSADTAIQAALTGHKVLTTFHTEDSIGGLLRLLHMDIEAFLISSTVVCVVAQRLLRRVCDECGVEHRLAADEIRRLGYNPAETRDLVFRRGTGCPHCNFLGYRGRVGVFEILILNEPVRDALINRRTSFEIRRICAESTGLVSLLEDGIVKATQGQTSFEEIIRTLPRLDKPRPVAELNRLLGVRS
jgi:type IV pilus assembly protein PilB